MHRQQFKDLTLGQRYSAGMPTDIFMKRNGKDFFETLGEDDGQDALTVDLGQLENRLLDQGEVLQGGDYGDSLEIQAWHQLSLFPMPSTDVPSSEPEVDP